MSNQLLNQKRNTDVGESNFNSGKSQCVLSLMINKDFQFHVLLYVKSHNDESVTVIVIKMNCQLFWTWEKSLNGFDLGKCLYFLVSSLLYDNKLSLFMLNVQFYVVNLFCFKSLIKVSHCIRCVTTSLHISSCSHYVSVGCQILKTVDNFRSLVPQYQYQESLCLEYIVISHFVLQHYEPDTIHRLSFETWAI